MSVMAGNRTRAGVSHHSLQGAQHREAGRAEIGAVRKSHLPKNFLGAPREAQENLPAIPSSADSFQKAMCLEPIRQFNCAVMLNLQALGKQADGGIRRNGQSFDGKQRLILLRLDSGGARSLFAQILEAPHLITEFRERAIVDLLCSDSQG